jgi:hypothetical protein
VLRFYKQHFKVCNRQQCYNFTIQNAKFSLDSNNNVSLVSNVMVLLVNNTTVSLDNNANVSFTCAYQVDG